MMHKHCRLWMWLLTPPVILVLVVFLGILLFVLLGRPFDISEDQALKRAEREIVRLARSRECAPIEKTYFEPVIRITEDDGYYFEVDGYIVIKGKTFETSMWVYQDFGFWFFKTENVETLGTTIPKCNQGD